MYSSEPKDNNFFPSLAHENFAKIVKHNYIEENGIR